TEHETICFETSDLAPANRIAHSHKKMKVLRRREGPENDYVVLDHKNVENQARLKRSNLEVKDKQVAKELMSAQEQITNNQPTHDGSSSILNWASRSLTSRQVVLFALALSVLVMIAHRPLIRSAGGDTTFYDYIAQSILRGQVPYRDVV